MGSGVITFQQLTGEAEETSENPGTGQSGGRSVAGVLATSPGTSPWPRGRVDFEELVGRESATSEELGHADDGALGGGGRGMRAGADLEPPGWTGVVVPPQFLPAGSVEESSFARRMTEAPDDPWEPANAPDPEMFQGLYKTYVYQVQYMAPTEVALPESPGIEPTLSTDASGPEEHAYTTYMRIHIPCFPEDADYEHLGVMFFFPGGTALAQGGGLDPAADAVAKNESAVPFWQLWIMSVLASGVSHPGVDEAEDDWSDGGENALFFRDGAPMIAVTFEYPGRGSSYHASGAPEFIGDTPANHTGQDFAGAMTVAAAEAVMDATMEIVAYLQDQWMGTGELGIDGTRLVACSWSWGSYPAARWVAESAHQVHALIDYEGPADSEEQAAWGYNPFKVQPDEESGMPPADLPQDWLTFPFWASWYVSHPEGFWCRPPEAVLGALPTSWVDFAAGIVGYGTAMGCSAEEAAARAALSNWWLGRYGQPFVWQSLQDQLSEFWNDRDPTTHLATFQERGTAYVRFQCDEDHFQPPWMFQRHAVKALNAATGGGASWQHVYFTDHRKGYGEALLSQLPMGPAGWATRYDPDDDEEAWARTPPWSQFVLLDENDGRWGVTVDLARWAVGENFTWSSSATGLDSPDDAM
jgi:hypothetical protein